MKRCLLPKVFILAVASGVVIAQQQSGSGTAGSGGQAAGSGATTDQRAGAASDQATARNAAEDENMAGQSPDQKFVNCIARNNLFEIETGKLVLQKASNEQVKKAAQMMIDDHKKSQDQLKQTAQQANVKVPDKLLSWQEAKLQYLSRLPAEDLQAMYAFHLVAAHHMAILEAQRGMKMVQNEQLKSFARTTNEALQSHLQQANAIASSFAGGSASITGEPVSNQGSQEDKSTGQHNQSSGQASPSKK